VRNVVIAVLIGTALASALVTSADARTSRLQAHLRPVGQSNVRGKVVWPEMSELVPLDVRIRGARPLSQVALRVCGPTEEGISGNVFDQCWATFTDRDRHILSIQVNRKGKAEVQLFAKLAVASVHLLEAERVELYDYPSGQLIAMGELHPRGHPNQD
jgi:hypothetical protein